MFQSENDQQEKRYRVVLSPCQILITYIAVALLPGCNPYWSPVTINPKSELNGSNGIVSDKNVTFHVPKGWVVEEARRDENGGLTWVEMNLLVSGKRAGYLFFIPTPTPPPWAREAGRKVFTTERHKDVHYVFQSVDPSGDDTPGKYEAEAYLESGNSSWKMEAAFLRPVRPDLATSLQYVDVLEYNSSSSK